MRWALVSLVAFLVWAPAAAAVPTRGCATRGEGSAPIRRLVAPGDLQIGPVAFFGLARMADPREFERFRSGRPSGRYLIKTPLKVRAGRVVTVSVAPPDRAAAGLTFDSRAPLDTGVPAVRFAACDKDKPAFSYDGVVGSVTAFPGGFSLAGPSCVHLSVRVRGRPAAYLRTVSFGMGPVAGNCDKI